MRGTAVGRHSLIRTFVRPAILGAAVPAVAALVVTGIVIGISVVSGSSSPSEQPDVLTAGERLTHTSAEADYTAVAETRAAEETARRAAEEQARKAAEEAAREAAEEQARQRAEANAAAEAEAERKAAAERAARAAERAAVDPKSAARAMLGDYGWGEDQFGCLDSLWTRESNWDHRAHNPTSGAYGIPQSLPGDKMSSAGADWRTNPLTQIEWGLGYIGDVYGSPCGAWGHSQSAGWY